MKFTTFATLLAASLPVLVAAKPTIKDLQSSCTLHTSATPVYIGEHKNVLVQTASCPTDIIPVERRTNVLEARQTTSNVCGATCNTNCFAGSTPAPTVSDCHVIADALLYESKQTGGDPFNVTSGANQVTMTFQNCATFFLNQNPPNTLSYCRSAWSQLVDWLSTDCTAAKGTHGGNCVAADGRWFVQVNAP